MNVFEDYDRLKEIAVFGALCSHLCILLDDPEFRIETAAITDIIIEAIVFHLPISWSHNYVIRDRGPERT